VSDTGDVGPAGPDAGSGPPGSEGGAAGNGGGVPGSEGGGAGNGGSGDGNHGGGAAADGGGAADDGGPADPRELLGEVRAIRRRARLARHAYWFPLVLFGLLVAASVPFYVQRLQIGPGWHGGSVPSFLRSGYLGGFGLLMYSDLPYYWLGAMVLGIAATVVWYRWRGNRVGLRTPARGYLITGVILVALALLIPVIAQRFPQAGPVFVRPLIMPGDLVLRGTFPLVLIGLGLCVLAWAERSVGLAVIAACYLALSLVASLYDIENVFYRLGWNLSPQASRLPNVVLPALVLLLSGAGAWVVQRRRGPRPTGPVGDGGHAATGQA
jgi:hypothetical protein